MLFTMTSVLRRIGVFPWILLAALALRLMFYTGIQGGDDSYYYLLALRILKGLSIAPNDLLQTRLGYVLPLAGLFSLFGPTTTSLITPGVVASLAMVAMAYWLGRDLGSEAVGRISAGFVALLPIDILCATTATTDAPMAAWIGLGVCLARSAGSGPSGPWSHARAALAGLSWGMAWLTRESAPMFILPVLPFLLKKPLRRELLVTAGVLAAVGVGYLTAYGVVRGDPLYPMTVAHRALMGQEMPQEGLLRRVVTLPSLCFNPWDAYFPFTGGLMAFSAAGCVLVLVKDRTRCGGLAGWWLGSALILILLPLSFFPFRPAVFIVPRMYTMLTLPGAVLAGIFITETLSVRAPRIAVAAVAGAALLATVCAWRIHGDAALGRSGPEWAHRQLRGMSAGEVVTDPRTAVLMQILAADAPPYRLRVCGPGDPAPAPGTLILKSSRQSTISRKWNQFLPPAWWDAALPPRDLVAEQRVPAPPSLRGARGPEEHTVLWRIVAAP